MKLVKLLIKTFPWKLALFALTCLAAWLFFFHKGQVKSARKFADHAPTTGNLSATYREMNEDYFYGSLPIHKTEITLGDLSALDDLGHIFQRADGTWVIVVDRASHVVERQAEMTLVHEMCHQAVMGGYMRFAGQKDSGLDGHSGAFEACMRSVANRGGFKDLW